MVNNLMATYGHPTVYRRYEKARVLTIRTLALGSGVGDLDDLDDQKKQSFILII